MSKLFARIWLTIVGVGFLILTFYTIPVDVIFCIIGISLFFGVTLLALQVLSDDSDEQI